MGVRLVNAGGFNTAILDVYKRTILFRNASHNIHSIRSLTRVP